MGKLIGICQDALLEIDGIRKPERDEPWLVQMLGLMKEYFTNHFFPTFGTELNEKIQPLIRRTSEIRETTITTMVASLSDGLPIPSKKEVTEDTYSETPASVQEVLLSAWMYRNIGLKKQLLAAISELPTTADNPVFMEAFSKNVINPLSRFDFSVIRSIQVGEWFDVLVPTEGKKSERRLRKSDNKVRSVLVGCESDKSDKTSLNNKVGSVLVDWEIEELIRSNRLHVIPIIDLETQLGSTSLDIRLGTSFQLFYQNQYGIFDSTEPTAHISLQQSSVLRDLDFLEGLTLFPGQFILGHSMEYLRFPGHIAAEIEGRSSFARLGIEVHMTAGFVDPGYEGVLTYEIYNAGANPVRLYPGTRIAQLRFFTTNVPSKSYDKKPEGKYFGLLAHNNSLQFKDYEIKKIREEKYKYQQRRDYGLI